MRKTIALAVAGVLTVGLLAAAPAALASQRDVSPGDVAAHGACSGQSNWKLSLSPQGGKIEAEFEVDQNVSGDTWKVTMRDNGNVFFQGRRRTHGDSGSFDVRKFVNDAAGKDRFVASAENLSTNEVCTGKATF